MSVPLPQQYTCPMHPEIIRDQPGSCPICGMSLELRIISAKMTRAKCHHELDEMLKRFWLSIMLTLPILFLTMGLHIPGIKSIIASIPDGFFLVAIHLASIVILWCGYPLLKKTCLSIKYRHLNMFTLIGLGISLAYVYSIIGLLFPNLFPAAFQSVTGQANLYFETASVIMALVLMGQVLELKGREQTGGALRTLLDLSPKTARKIKN